ncbi:MAG TPA: hypothetical protein PL196_00505 [Burkholderiaceae bacterium]|nr:hypothetical protein [Burkholderiaceae bacterium]
MISWPGAWRCFAALLLCGCNPAQAQKVYRCGPDGRIYQQSPCNDGKAVDASDPRTAEQRQAAQEVARGEAKAAAKFDRDNLPASGPKPAKAPRVAPAASDPKAAEKPKPAPPEKPLVFLPPPKPAASAAKP